MRKTTLLLLLVWPHVVFSQCLTALPPPACTGSEPSLTDNETLNAGVTKWYYGATTTMNTLTMNGGTLVVCGNLTIDRFYMDSGTVYVRPGARFVIGSGIGSGLQLRGNSAFYNYGTLEIQRNLSLDNGWATPEKPNIVMNATSASVFHIANQYVVINNADSWLVNNGSMQAWGIITDMMAQPGSVCLGLGSSTRMAVLINKIADTYKAPSGNACVNVYQFSEFRNRLSNTPNLFVCLGSGHNSYSGCGGCPANNWGLAQVFTTCADCASLGVLSSKFNTIEVTAEAGSRFRINWQFSAASSDGRFTILRSSNGRDYLPVDSIAANESNSQYSFTDNHPLPGDNYYMIRYSLPDDRTPVNSNPVKISTAPPAGLTIFPMPFEDRFSLTYGRETTPNKIILTDITGRNIPIRYKLMNDARQVDVEVVGQLQPGIYIVHIRTGSNNMAKTIIRR